MTEKQLYFNMLHLLFWLINESYFCLFFFYSLRWIWHINASMVHQYRLYMLMCVGMMGIFAVTQNLLHIIWPRQPFQGFLGKQCNVLAIKIISISLRGDVFLYKSSINEIKHFQIFDIIKLAVEIFHEICLSMMIFYDHFKFYC